MAESKSNIIYKGLTWGNYHYKSSQWLKSIYDEDVKFEMTPLFTYQCKTDDDYGQHLAMKSRDYDEMRVTLLVKDGFRVV